MRFPVLLLILGLAAFDSQAQSTNFAAGMRKVRDLVIYRDDKFHAAFPSAVKRPGGEVLVAFRRAPERRALGEKTTYHVDPNSYLVMVRSGDNAQTWSKEPELIYAHAFGGSQDPCLLQLRDNTLLCASYGWSLIRPDGLPNLKPPVMNLNNGFIFLGGYLVRSSDGGKSWQGPFYPPHLESEINHDPYGKPIPAFNRGEMCEGRDGRIFWVVAANDAETPRKSSTHLLISGDKGRSWNYSCPVAVDDKVTFNETSIYETPKGDLVAFLRTANLDDYACIVRSTDGGKSFQKWEDLGFQGHPFHALGLPDKRVLLTYGYRHKPIGIRARILDPECSNASTAPEFVLRDDGGSTDIGYPWSVQLDPRHVLVTYYFNQADGARHIAGTILEVK